MAFGQETASWSYTISSTTYTPGPGKAMTIQINMGGPVTGEVTGMSQGTLTAVAEPGAKTGTWSWCGAIFLEGGGIVGMDGQGALEESGTHQWNMHGFVQASDGRSWPIEMDGNFATQSLTGKAFSRS